MTQRKRELWLDALRIAAAFGVIVNHTNSRVFQAASPQEATWWLSIVWYYLSKLAVPVFVVVSGACLLPGQDSIRTSLRRFGRILGALLVFSYGYYLYDAWVNWGLFPRMFNLSAFIELVWTQQITDGFWYLYFYMGLMLMLPLLQRMNQTLEPVHKGYLIGLCVLLDCVWPLAAHYVPKLALPGYFDAPLFTSYLGLFFFGGWLRSARISRKSMFSCAIILAVSLAASVLLTRIEFDRVAPGAKYWFMDERTQPSLFTTAGAAALAVLAKGGLQGLRHPVWAQLGGCAFGIYLVQDFLIAQTKNRVFEPMCSVIPAFPAALLWEAGVFAVALAAAWIMRRIPVLKKIL